MYKRGGQLARKADCPRGRCYNVTGGKNIGKSDKMLNPFAGIKPLATAISFQGFTLQKFSVKK